MLRFWLYYHSRDSQNVLSYTHATTAKLQTSEGDIVKGYSEIDIIKGTLQNTIRKHINSYNDTWFDKATKLAETVGVSPSKPRACSRQKLRAMHRQKLRETIIVSI